MERRLHHKIRIPQKEKKTFIHEFAEKIWSHHKDTHPIMNTPCLVFLFYLFIFLPDICLLHLQALQYFQELKCNCNQSWKERTEWFNSELINWRSSCFRCHPWVFIMRWPHMMTSPDGTTLIDFLFWCVLYWIHLGGRLWQENLVKLFTNWMQLWGTCSNNPNHVYRIFSPHWSCIWWNNMHNWSKPQRHHKAKHMKHIYLL